MLKLDNNLLQDLGLGTLPEDQKKAMLNHIYETLELRVGTQLANQMTDKQLEEFERFIDTGGDQNQAQALQWLETNLPNYKQVVNDVFEALKVEIRGMAPQIMAGSTQQSTVQQSQDAQQFTDSQDTQTVQVTYSLVDATPEEQKTVQLYIDNGYRDVAVVVSSTGQRLLRSRAPLDDAPSYKPV